MGVDHKPVPDGNDRIEYGTLGIRKRLVFSSMHPDHEYCAFFQ